MSISNKENTNKDFERLLVFLASGLVEFHDRTLAGTPIRSPYPKALQQGIDKLVALQLDHNVPLICGLQDLLNLANQSFSSWNINMPEYLANPSDKLLDHGLPTNFCLQWVHEQGIDAHEQEQLLPKVMEICRRDRQPEAYSYFRTILIQEPVIDAMRLQEIRIEPSLRLLANEFGEAYIPAPSSAIKDGFFMLCKHCNGLLLRIEGGEFQCENERCRSKGTNIVGKTIRATKEVYWLTSGLRRYVAQPGLAEVELRQSLEALGVIVEMWPNFDAYDLRVTVADEFWAIDVKDWANPFLLAQQAKPLREKPRWDRAFYIFPDERKQQRADYLRAFNNHWQKPPKTKALMKSGFIKEVRKKLEGV